MSESPPGGGGSLAVAVSGHRKLGDPRVSLYVHAECVRLLRLLSDLAAAQGRMVEAWSALAIGADTLFAHAAIGLGIPVVGVIPFERYPEDFEGPDRAQFDALRGWCVREVAISGRDRSDQAYLAGGHLVVDQAEVLVAVWNGLPAAGVGGTADVVAYARSKGRTVFRIDPARAPLIEPPAKAAPNKAPAKKKAGK